MRVRRQTTSFTCTPFEQLPPLGHVWECAICDTALLKFEHCSLAELVPVDIVAEERGQRTWSKNVVKERGQGTWSKSVVEERGQAAVTLRERVIRRQVPGTLRKLRVVSASIFHGCT
jgi:hypothetical protein